MKSILRFYRAFSTEEGRNKFIAFCNPYLIGVYAEIKLLHMNFLLSIYQAFSTEEGRNKFIAFCSPYLVGVGANSKPHHMVSLLSIYQAFATEEERNKFIAFSDPYLIGVYAEIKESRMKDLLPIYQAFATEEERNKFIAFCNPYLVGVNVSIKESRMKDLLPIYQAFATEEERNLFIAFCNPYLVGVNASIKESRMKDLLPIYQAFATEEERNKFIAFCNPYLVQVRADDKTSCIKSLLSLYQAFATEEERNQFIDFCDRCLVGVGATKVSSMKSLLPIYLSNNKEDFELFIRLHSRYPPRVESLISSYLPGSYLRYMRVNGALEAERITDPSRVQSMYETGSNDPLPVLRAADRFLPQARGMRGNGTANAHDFEAVYELDRPILWDKAQEFGYESSQSPIAHTIYNNSEIKPNYHTNKEVEDFITYLDDIIAKGPGFQADKNTISGPKVALIIKQMLGLEQKRGTTRGGFAPYLSSSMYYAKPESPLGDEILGRVWHIMKIIAKNEQDLELNKRSVALAFLEAAEISQTSVDTHCQTRITGELMKLVSWHLEGSKLRPLIAATDLPPVQSDADIEARITAAPIRAQELFRFIKREDSGAIRRLLDHSYATTGNEPKLWQRYEAYYDDLYRRTKTEDGNGYRLDEHILMRDDRGNLVSKYNTDGSLRVTPVIVYYQSEFQVFEKTFTELMSKEFEKQKGVKY